MQHPVLTYRAVCLNNACDWTDTGGPIVDSRAARHTKATGHATLTSATPLPTGNTTGNATTEGVTP